ncbi:MAG: peptide-methionine (S)-S-oxide reductase MsrA [Nitrospirae bacterium]|nr:peptide-methionine (S)-S-oxide reductase MsrA [Nitrospirota bacterium]
MKRFGFKILWLWVALWILIVPFSAGAEEKPLLKGKQTEVATFAGGCFWCMVPPFKKLEGVVSVTSGYTGGHVENPTYEEVSSGNTGHAEAVEIVYDPLKISYQKLLDVFWHNIDPTAVDYQFCDHGNQYRSGVFYHTDMQKRLAEESRAALEKTKPFKGPIVTKISPALKFYPAEEYHQDFYNKSPIRYKFYRHRCGRDQRLEELWGKSNTPH